MKKYHIKVKDKVVHRTDNIKEVMKVTAAVFRDGQEEVFLHGGRIGKWWNE
jgi:hypothetical protein